MSSILNALGYGDPYQGAPAATGPNQSAYQLPNQAGLQQGLTSLQNQPGVSLNTTNAAQDRSQQEQQLQGLFQQANGTAPSAAQMQMQQGLQNSQAQSMGAASAARGVNPLAALRQQQTSQGNTNQQSLASSASLRAQEQAQGQQTLAGTLQGMSQTDLAGATAQLQADTFNKNFQSQVLGQQMGLSQMVQAGNIGFDQAQVQFSAYQRQQYVDEQSAKAAGMRAMIGTVLSTAGAVAGSVMGGPAGSMVAGAGIKALTSGGGINV